MSAREHILETFAELSPALQGAARFVVDHPNEVVTGSMRSLAARAGVQPATLVRLAQRLGYAGWPALKAGFVADLGLHSAGYGARAGRLATRARRADLAGELFAAHRHNLEATQRRSTAALPAAAAMLRRARAVYVAGFRASHPVAYALYYGYRLFRDSVHLVDGVAGGIEAQLRPLRRGDVVLVIGFAPYSRESMQVLERARSAGAAVLALTDSDASPLALAARQVLLFAADSPSFFPSVACAVALSEALLERLVAEGGRPVVAQIERAEQQLVDAGAYVLPQGRRGS
ncbi:MAG: MurR/RpiR family transcriptional regulator [Burkholderiales bacterium]|nr:MurR/RpiR family transcriptional regulator [Burkholderiales bacterium]